MVSNHREEDLRAQEIAMENRIPIIYLVDSAGVFLPMQDEIFPDKEHFGKEYFATMQSYPRWACLRSLRSWVLV